MTKAERTRQFIIEQTAPLFNCKGFEGTSLSDLTQATGLTKGAIYGNFEDKEEIAHQAFLYAVKKVKRTVIQKLSVASTCEEQLIALIDFYAEYVFNPPITGGCPLLNSAIETDDLYPKRRRALVKELLSTIEFITSLLEKGKKNGEFKKHFDSRKLAYIIFCGVEGALMFARATRSQEPMTILVDHLKELLKQIKK